MLAVEFDETQINDFLATLSGPTLDKARMRAINKAASMGRT